MFSIETLERILKCGLFSIERAEKYRRTVRKWQVAVINGATKYADMTIDMLDDYIDYARDNQHRKTGTDE